MIVLSILLCACNHNDNRQEKVTKLYWFIPDGMRADPEVFDIYTWANQGKLPNIKKMMDNGVYGYSVPVFPSHTPTNFATLLTGTYPKTHGIADGPMHIEGRPLDKVSISGFSSVAKKVPPIWTTMEEQGKKVLLLSIPGSTPPELNKGITVRGRWSGWGAEFNALIFQSKEDLSERKRLARGSRLFFFGPELTKYIAVTKANGWFNPPASYSAALEAEMNGYGTSIYAYISDSTNDNITNYDAMLLSFDKKSYFAQLKRGDWSNWSSIVLKWNGIDVNSHVIINLIKFDEDGFFRLRCYYDNLNGFIATPPEVAGEFDQNVGPMADFVDNFPSQLVYYDEDKKSFIDEMDMTFSWHTKAIPFILRQYQPDVVIHDAYSPNQMLTSRWWLGYIDPESARYKEVTELEREQLWKEVKDMYKKLDDMVGEILKNTDKNTIIVLSSDHGAAALNKYVRINNILAKNGLLKFKINSSTGEPIIDWENSKAIFLNMYNIFLNPWGLAGNYTRTSGPEYEALRNQVIDILSNIKDKDGTAPVAQVTKWEDVEKELKLPKNRVGDLVITNRLGYGWYEEMTDDLEIFSTPLITGYKQALNPQEKSLWTPFIIMGPGIKHNYHLKNPISNVDQYPTIFRAMDLNIPNFVEGKIQDEIFTR